MEERVPPDGKEDPPPSPHPLESPSLKKYPLPRPPPPRSRSKTARNDPRLTKSQDYSFTFPLPPSDHEINPDPFHNINKLTTRLFNPSPSFPVSSLPPPLSSHEPERPQETYVVQIPKDQVFRIPPPENAVRYENLQRPQKKKCPGNCCLWILMALVIFGLIVGLGIWAIHFLYNPRSPQFSVTDITVNVPPPSHHKPGKPVFNVALKVDNPNERLGIVYVNGGQSSLSFKNRELAKGNYPSSSQKTKESMAVQVILPSSNAALPPEIQKGVNDTKSKTGELSFGLTVNVPIKFTSWMKPTKKGLTVTCNFKVKTLAKSSQVSDQQCTS